VDNHSRELLDKIIKFRHTLDFIDYPRPQTLAKQYLEPTFIDRIDKIIMLDLGSYNGDSAEDLIDCYEHKTERIYCVEPSYENLTILRNFRNSHQKYLDRIVPVMCALGDKNEFANLSLEGSSTSLDKLDLQFAIDSKSMVVPVCTLDSFFTDMGINLIKMDIEGYELNVIKGAKKYIIDSSPFMAIALYHKPTDLYTIPNEILEINSDYTFMLRLYSECLRELVLYCIPKS
jgi:FkbM family methyltransferase